jgi:hypothetical protein
MSVELKIPDKVKNIIFIVEGGLGKEIASTAVIQAIKTKYPQKNIIVVAGFTDIFLYNPNVKKVFNFGNPLYFYDDYINDEAYVIRQEPYLEYEYISKKSHLIDVWCKQIGVEPTTLTPDIYFLENEIDAAKMYVDNVTENGKKELILLQWIGGKVPKDKTPAELKGSLAAMYRRSLPQDTAQKLVNKLVETNKYVVGNVAHENFPDIKNTNRIHFPIRSVIALLKHVKTFIGIDSFLQHAAASSEINKQGVVCWGGTSPICLGYDTHVNLTKSVCNNPFCHRPNSYLFDMQSHGAMWDCTYGDRCMKAFTADEIFQECMKIGVEKVEVKSESQVV